MGAVTGEESFINTISGELAGIGVERDAAGTSLRVTIGTGRGNRLGLAQVERLLDIATGLGALATATDACRVVVLEANGPDFSHGANLADPALVAQLNQGRVARISFAARGQALVSHWREIPVPTIVVATGHVVGAGACLFLAADFRVAAPGTVVCFPEVDRGMHLGWGIVPRLVSLLGEARALRLALLGEAIKVEELADVVTVTGDSAGEALRLAERLVDKPAPAVRAILAVLRESTRSVDAAAQLDAARWADTLESAEFAEAMVAWYGRRLAEKKSC